MKEEYGRRGQRGRLILVSGASREGHRHSWHPSSPQEGVVAVLARGSFANERWLEREDANDRDDTLTAASAGELVGDLCRSSWSGMPASLAWCSCSGVLRAWHRLPASNNALGEPMCGCPSWLKRTRSIALASVAVPTVERASAPIRSWSTMIVVVRPSSTSTSGRASVGMKPCTKALQVSLISRCDCAAIVENTSELLPEPETPVNTASRHFGISTLTALRLFSRALHADQIVAMRR